MPTFQTIGLQQSTTKVLSLWNGSSNDSPPAGWGAAGFDDSGWSASSSPTVSGTLVRLDPVGSGNAAVGTPIGTGSSALPSGVQAIAPWVTPPSIFAQFLLRAHFTLPTDPWAYYLAEQYGNSGCLAPGYSVLSNPGTNLYLNGTLLGFTGTGAAGWDQFYANLVAGDNVLALWIGIRDQVWQDTTQGWSSFRLTFWQPDTGGQAYAWGTITAGVNDQGVLGVGDTSTHLTKTACDAALPTNVTKVVTNGKTTLFLTADQNVWACGDNSAGLLGIGSTDSSTHATPVKITPAAYTTVPNTTAPIVDVAIGNDCAIAVGREGNLYSWGPNAHGSLGVGNTTARTSPTRQSINNVPRAIVSAGGDFSAFVDLQGNVQTAGGNTMGQLGQGTSGADVTSYTVAQWLNSSGVAIGVPTVVAIAAGDQKLLAVDGAANLYGCGTALDGSLGFTNYNAGIGANKIQTKLRAFASISGLNDAQQCGPLTFAAVTGGFGPAVDGWGDGVPYGGAGDNDGTVAYGTTLATDHDVVRKDFFGTQFNIRSKLGQGGPSHNPYSSGNSQAAGCAVGTDGKLYTWGYGGFGQMGSGADANTNLFASAVNGLTGVIAACMANQIVFAVASVGAAPPVTTTRRGRASAQVIG